MVRFDIYISEAVLHEIRTGDPDAVIRRLAIIDGLQVLTINDRIRYLLHIYDSRLGLRGRAKADLTHIAFAVAYEMDFLVTWNCSHIANGEVIRRLIEVNKEVQSKTPIILTPEEMMEPKGR